MHFCQDELLAILAVMPWATSALVWLRARFSRKGGRKLPDPSQGPYRAPCPCPEHKPSRFQLLKQRIQEGPSRIAEAVGPIWPFW